MDECLYSSPDSTPDSQFLNGGGASNNSTSAGVNDFNNNNYSSFGLFDQLDRIRSKHAKMSCLSPAQMKFVFKDADSPFRTGNV